MTMDALIPLLLIALIAAAVIGGLVQRRHEIREYNGGLCRHCGTLVVQFDADSQGGTGWICRNCGHSFWTSYI